MKTGQIIRKAVLQLLQEYELRVAEAKKALNDFCACSPNDLDNFDVLNAKFEDAKKHQFDVADKLAFMLSRYADQLDFSDEPLAETLDDLIALAASEETLTDPVVASEASPVMSAKCRLCPSCVDGRCFFVPDVYDSEFPCQSPAWDAFFKSGGSHGPAP